MNWQRTKLQELLARLTDHDGEVRLSRFENLRTAIIHCLTVKLDEDTEEFCSSAKKFVDLKVCIVGRTASEYIQVEEACKTESQKPLPVCVHLSSSSLTRTSCARCATGGLEDLGRPESGDVRGPTHGIQHATLEALASLHGAGKI